MKNKGFTLIELLATITVLGIVSTIAVASVSLYTKRAREKAYCQLKESIVTAANNYIISKKGNGGNYVVGIETLVSEGFLDSPTDPSSNTNCVISGATVDVERKIISNDLKCGKNGDKDLNTILSRLNC